MTKKMKIRYLLLFIVFFYVYLLEIGGALSPSGANLSYVNSSTTLAQEPDSVPAQAGNITELNIFGYSTTQTWQGYYGNVTGVIQLGDGSGEIIYNWSAANPRGEVYASTNSSILWKNIECLNFTSDGTMENDLARAGNTGLHGTNLTQLESLFNINSSDVDGVEETFAFFGAVNGHRTFYSSNYKFDVGECRSTRVFDDSGGQSNDAFEEALMYEPVTTSIIFTALLENSKPGFDNREHDFEMIVLEDGHEDNTATTPYYFYIEIE